MQIGNNISPQAQIAPFATEQILVDVEKQVQESVKKSATVLLSEKRLTQKGYLYSSTVVTKGMLLYE